MIELGSVEIIGRHIASPPRDQTIDAPSRHSGQAGNVAAQKAAAVPANRELRSSDGASIPIDVLHAR
jgi:hypothetical protein